MMLPQTSRFSSGAREAETTISSMTVTPAKYSAAWPGKIPDQCNWSLNPLFVQSWNLKNTCSIPTAIIPIRQDCPTAPF